MNRQEIIEQIKRIALENGGTPPGKRQFQRLTGVTEACWSGRFWARWSDAQTEAGFQPNELQGKRDTDDVIAKLVDAILHYKAVPTYAQLKLYRQIDGEFPSRNSLSSHFSDKQDMLEQISKYIAGDEKYEEVAFLIGEVLSVSRTGKCKTVAASEDGYVYLLQSGAHYKIGRSDNLERRVKEITIALPEALKLIHAISTDDPVGIESYWHNRFKHRRARGEWFKLDRADVQAFKRRKFQ